MALKSYLEKDRLEAGCDEAGRGCLAGPVVAAAVILPPGLRLPGLDDSKKLTPKKRQSLRLEIEEKALTWAVAFVDNHEVDEVNVLNASFLAMHRALDQLSTQPEHLLIDGNRFNPYPDIAHSCIIGGDGKFRSIAAASILAKQARDDYMEQLHSEYPQYDWQSNKGYPTKKHRAAIAETGPSPYHRMSFSLLDKQLKMPF